MSHPKVYKRVVLGYEPVGGPTGSPSRRSNRSGCGVVSQTEREVARRIANIAAQFVCPPSEIERLVVVPTRRKRGLICSEGSNDFDSRSFRRSARIALSEFCASFGLFRAPKAIVFESPFRRGDDGPI